MASRDFTRVAAIAVFIFAGFTSAADANYTVLHRFIGRSFSANPLAPLIADKAGNFYGTASTGGNGGCVRYGSTGCGTVFQLAPPSAKGGSWKETVLFRFAGGTDPWFPMAGLTMDSTGNLFGMTADSPYAAPYECFTKYCGTAFELSPPSKPGQTWTETVLHRFSNGADGGNPSTGLTPDGNGSYYGTTCTGGPNNTGTVFQLTPPVKAGGRWTKTMLSGFSRGGNCPAGNLLFGNAGELYGTTLFGGYQSACQGAGCGLVFKLTPRSTPGQTWTETVLYAFGRNACFPKTNLIFNTSGILYGTTQGCPALPGAVFRLTPPAKTGGSWTEEVLTTFNGPNGDIGTTGLIFDDSGNPYGSTETGGTYGRGTIYQLKPPSWTETVLHNFNVGDGDSPAVGPIFGNDGALYGITTWGGSGRGVCKVSGCGVFFRIAPR